METKGIELSPLRPSKTAISGRGGAKSDAPDAPKPPQDPDLAALVIEETLAAAEKRLDAETLLSKTAIEAGEDPTGQRGIIDAWSDWYRQALDSAADIELGCASETTRAAIEAATRRLNEVRPSVKN